MNAFKQQCIELRKKDYTLPEIVKETGRSKTSVYFHIKNTPLSRKKQKEVREASIKRALKVAEERRGKSLKSFRRFTVWDKNMVLLVSHLIFDGEIRRTGCGYSNRSKVLVDRVQELFKLIYSYEPKHHFNTISGVIQIRHHNVALAAHILEKAEQLLREIIHSPLSYKKEFIRAFFDDEGCMDFRPDRNHRRIRGYQNDKDTLKLIKALLVNFGIESKLQGKNEVVIRGKENLQKFQKEINFSKGVRINGNRSNSIWKKSLEKRELLKMAILSYKT